ncbi:unnamed protein product, partial [Ectocarpus sp. 12 AP-2014]
GDGDCLLHSLCHIQEPGVPDCHIKTRKRIIAFMRDNPNHDVEEYLTLMEQQGTWCDEVMAQAYGAMTRVKVHVV